jgi:hypothetical protein
VLHRSGSCTAAWQARHLQALSCHHPATTLVLEPLQQSASKQQLLQAMRRQGRCWRGMMLLHC